ncbi:DUF2809 domain-containing protein [Nonomuraea rhodomycinica]|uniref:DUF2809 domain-containing protein n=1 Tax=Nonomuraea rhodomycinica TaxID=1712872 RepID=A0A7Y6IXP7_9ACTN|nr:DUF2809 domain-containing protein [Nonomuraea rhodomycinica]NUW45966.1 DUF2809 domain-containing protein [Nonomuraea rhodomycinica]
MPRLPVLLAAVLTVAAGLGVRALTGGAFAKYAGDALYTVLIQALVVLVVPRVRPVTAALVAAGLSWVIEFAQLAEVPQVLRPVLGSTFNPPDLLWYAVGAAAACAVHAYALGRIHQDRPDRGSGHPLQRRDPDDGRQDDRVPRRP